MSTRDIIDAIDAGDSTGVMSAFENAMMARVAVKLDDLRVQTAQSMFKAPEAMADTSVEGAQE